MSWTAQEWPDQPVLEDPGGEPLDRLLGAPLELGRFLPLAVGIAAALAKVHQRGLVRKDLKPAHILVNCTDGQVRLTGFGLALRLPRARQTPEPPEMIAGTLAYMAPEQTGRMNRSIDSRSDLYALGVTLYQMLTGTPPFTASDPMEWVHCHIARNPIPLAERLANVPAAVSAIIMKLLAKTAEDRYQTADGAERDLRRCLVEWEARRHIDDFPLGQRDTPDRLLIPEKLYGRAREIETLLAAFDRIVKSGAPELVLVSGYSGIGKSSVVHELHKVLVPPRGLFAAGKFDQYKRDIPYSTLAQAFQPDAEAWRRRRETLDAHLPFRDFEIARPTPDGGKRYVSVSGPPVFDDRGRFIGYRGVGRHITERKRAEAEARDKERRYHEMQMELAHANRVATMGQLTASIAHEVNHPIGAVLNTPVLPDDIWTGSRRIWARSGTRSSVL